MSGGVLAPVAVLRTPFAGKFGVPRQAGLVPAQAGASAPGNSPREAAVVPLVNPATTCSLSPMTEGGSRYTSSSKSKFGGRDGSITRDHRI